MTPQPVAVDPIVIDGAQADWLRSQSGLRYHGTRAELVGGDIVLPGATVGTNHYPYVGHKPDDLDKYVYFHTDLDVAWSYAVAGDGDRNPRILVIVPIGPVEPDSCYLNGQPDPGAYRCPRAWVHAVLVPDQLHVVD